MTGKTVNRFFDKVIYSDNCWQWTAAKTDKRGYGYFWNGHRNVLSHRWSFEYFRHEIPRTLFVCHHCDNPSCVNPDHLFVGTNSDNMKDAGAKGRLPQQNGRNRNTLKTHCPKGHPYSGDNLYINPKGNRFCRTCRSKT